MKTSQDRMTGGTKPCFEADLEATVGALFRRYPALCGFTVQEAATLSSDRPAGQLVGDLFLADLGIHPSLAQPVMDRVFSDVADALLDFIDECPEARELLCGRTFARVLH